MARIGILSTFEDDTYSWGGSEYLWSVIAEQALVDGHEVLLSISECSASHPIVVKLRHQGAKVFVRPLFSSSSKIQRKLRQLLLLQSLAFTPYKPMFDWKPDIIYISQSSSYDVTNTPHLIKLLKIAAIPYIPICQFNSDHWFLTSTNQSIVKDFFNNATQVAFVSYNNFKTAERHLAQSLPNTVVVQNPVNLSDLSLVPWPSQDTVCFASVARLEVVSKGQDILFESLSKPHWEQRNWQLSLYGSGPDQNYLKALAKYYGIANRIKLMGHSSDIRSIWAENHILLLPSRGEGTPLALVEAMLCGRPAVVTDVGGNAEWIEESKTGFIAEAPTLRSFDAALDRAWLAQDNWQRMGTNAHCYSLARHDRSTGKTLLKLGATSIMKCVT